MLAVYMLLLHCPFASSRDSDVLMQHLSHGLMLAIYTLLRCCFVILGDFCYAVRHLMDELLLWPLQRQLLFQGMPR